MGASQLEALLAFHIKAADLPKPVREYRFHPKRRWRLDFAWPDMKLAVEIDGGIFANKKGKVGAHVRGAGARADMEKRNEAIILGWRVLRVCGDHVKSGQALRWIEQAMGTPG